LVEALANVYSTYFNRKIDPLNEILVTGGAYPSLFNAINGFVNPGDEVKYLSSFLQYLLTTL
jgi:kynurenine--oxoglutarate transaminase/cysteine-S-conjugate beta-lyase/glutamine--phenylpyruvate transaminase